MRFLPATNGRRISVWRRAFSVLSLIAALSSGRSPASQQDSQTTTTLDLTARIPADQQGATAPGAQGGSVATPHYQFPLETRILRASADEEGNFVIEVLLHNKGSVAFDLPFSRDIGKVEEAGNRSRRIFFFLVRAKKERQREPKTIDGRATGGSTSLPGSYLHLNPGQSVRVLLPASANFVKQALP